MINNNKSNAVNPNNEKRKKGSLLCADAFPEIEEWWDFDKNKGIELSNISVGSKKKCYFHCPECGNEIYREMYRFLIKDIDGHYKPMVCRCCHPVVQKHRVSLVDAVPDIGKYWNYEKNEGRQPSEFSKSASDKVWTNCPICGTSVLRNVRFTWVKDENGIGKVLHCRTCGKRKSDNSLIELFPEIKEYWDEDNEQSPENYTITSGKKALIRCPQCEKTRKIAICDVVIVLDDGKYRLALCNKCAHENSVKKRRAGKYNAISACPELEKYWDEKNEIEISDVSLFSKVKIYTHCPSCNKLLYRRAINSFIRQVGEYKVSRCQKCAAKEDSVKRALAENGPIIKECPEFEEWWDFENNRINISKVTRGSHYEAYLRCPACNKKMVRDVHSFVSLHKDGKLLPVACPTCGYSSKGNPEDNLVKLCPDIVRWWDYKKNAPLMPEQFTKGSQNNAYLTCPDCGMELFAGIHSLLKTDDNGKMIIRHEGKCRKLKALNSDNNIVTNYPEIKKWWNYEKNYPNKPEEYTLFSPLLAYFKCPQCGGESHQRIADAFRLKEDKRPAIFDCVYCNGKRTLSGFNSLDVTHPVLSKEWSSNNSLSVKEVRKNMYYLGHWICPKCNGEYASFVSQREEGDDACPYCRNKRVLSGYNSLDVTNPELAKEWSNKNEEPASRFMKTSSFRAVWKCSDCGGEYLFAISEREEGDDACPYCRNKRVLPGYNSLLVRHNELVKSEWSELENILIGIDPDQLLENSPEQAWWKCKTCKKQYMMSIKDRLLKEKRHHNPCPFCNGRRWKKIYNV